MITETEKNLFRYLLTISLSSLGTALFRLCALLFTGVFIYLTDLIHFASVCGGHRESMKLLHGDSGVGFHSMASELLIERFGECSLLAVRDHVALRFSFSFLKIYLYLCAWVFCSHVCWALHACSAYENQKRAVDALELELQTVVTLCVGARNQT